ncbi:MAG TPA: hypothetical protein VFZ21_01860 [Gemmatimonadaceae bacterium]|nr:hypothetical protein [Gemmatimonadaceae bacterium]
MPLLTLLAHVLEPPTQVVLDREVLRALQRCHEARQRALLLLDEIEATPLNTQCVVQQRGYPLLIRRIAREHLGAQRHPNLPLLAQQSHPLALDALVHLTELAHLAVVQIEPPPDHLSEPLAKLAVERCAWRCALLRRPGRLAIQSLPRQLRRGNQQ